MAESSAQSRFHLVTCEHAGNRIPSRYAPFFRDAIAALHSHRGHDAGALRMARELAGALHAPLVVSAISRLLIDLNRSPGRADLYSEYSGALDPALREEIFKRYYLPFRTKVETQVAQALQAGQQVLHLSSHSFTPELHGEVRAADIGLLFDPERALERALCERWRFALNTLAPDLQVRMNYPYEGSADGLTTALRARFARGYAGIELELNQRHVHAGDTHWRRLREIVVAALKSALQRP
ncbi:MAG TPA: N-formylglutamate amidohydrolase [Noviherbaspirillum sp.]